MFTIQEATIEDIPCIRSMAMVVFPKTYKDTLSPEQIDYMMEWMYSEESLQRQMTEENHVYYIALHDGVPAGYLSIQPKDQDTWHLQKLYLLPNFQGMHIGKALFAHAVAVIKELHPTPCRLRLNVNRHNRAQDFYLKMGMAQVDEGDFPIGNGYYMNDYIMDMEI